MPRQLQQHVRIENKDKLSDGTIDAVLCVLIKVAILFPVQTDIPKRAVKVHKNQTVISTLPVPVTDTDEIIHGGGNNGEVQRGRTSSRGPDVLTAGLVPFGPEQPLPSGTRLW